MYKNEKEKNSCHYRDCKAITDNLSRIFSLSYPALIEYISRIKKEFAEIFGSKPSFCPKMTFSTLTLAVVLSTSIVSEAKADCEKPKDGVCKTFNTSGECGRSCSYVLKDGTIYITATGSDARIKGSFFIPQYYENNTVPAHNIVIDGPIKIGNNAFTGGTYAISGADGTLVFTGVEHHGFGDNVTLSGNIVIPSGTEFESIAFHGLTLADDAKIYCAVENCAQKMIDSCNGWEGVYRTRCLNAVNKFVSENKLSAYPDGCLNLNTKFECTKCKNENFKLNDGECDRLRYTPAEAAAVLHDDNTNSVTITFKK